jgi:hypothetical protein
MTDLFYLFFKIVLSKLEKFSICSGVSAAISAVTGTSAAISASTGGSVIPAIYVILLIVASTKYAGENKIPATIKVRYSGAP